MIEYLRGIVGELNRSIFVGERYEKNMRGITYAALLIIGVNVITGTINLMNGYPNIAIASAVFILSGLTMLFFTRIKRNRTAAVITASIAVVVLFTYEIFTVEHGFPIFWTLLFPLAFCYLADVRTGICISLYFLALCFLLFYTPVSDLAAAQYSDIIAQRFPILYLADVALTTYIMVQYHLTTLRQMDDAKELLEAKLDADRANAAKSEFLASMSHEIRTPINAVLGMNEMIQRESARGVELLSGESQDAREALDCIGAYAADVESAGNNLLSIINSILDISKLEAGKMDIVEAPYSLRTLVHDAYNLVIFKAMDKGLEFTVDVDGSIPDELCGDKVRVRQVIANILSNAVKYTDRGGVHMAVGATMDEGREPGRTLKLRVEVSDTGIGIKPEDVERLFSQFQRVDMDRNSTIEGTGLGLAITQGLLAMMGGTIQVKSEYGEGSMFTITIPQKIVSSEPVGDFKVQYDRGIEEMAVRGEIFRAPDAHILVVDDTKMNITVALGLLKRTELQIDTAGSGMEAIGLARDNAYDLILMDQRMPEMDGSEAMRRIKGQENGLNRETPIICLTADAIIGAKERYLAEGFTDYLTKPIDSNALERMLVKHLPEEKVLRVPRDKTQDGSDEARPAECASGDYAPLYAVDVDSAVGLRFCQNDDELYRSVLADYAQNAKEKACSMEQCLEERDWANLAILVHAVKSSSRMIGAAALADEAAALEQAADSADDAAIERGFPQMMARYRQVADAIGRMGLSEPESFSGDEEILEFLPE